METRQDQPEQQDQLQQDEQEQDGEAREAELTRQIERLNRRLVRERTARRAAEETAEQGMAELYAQNRRLDRQVARRTSELDDARQRAENALLASTTFLANLSHDLRTPINGILGMLELLQESELESGDKTLVNSAANSAQQLSSLLNRLLLYVDLDRWVKSEPKGIDIDPVLKDAVEEWSRRSLGAGQLLTLDSSVPAETQVRIDPYLLRFMLDELIANTVFHADPGAVRVEACVTERRALRISVVDSGPGLSPDDLQAYLEPFRHAGENSRETAAGTGLGLPLVVRLAEVMGGEMIFESEVASPTRVHLDLPPETIWVVRAADEAVATA